MKNKSRLLFLSSGFLYKKNNSYNLGDVAQQKHAFDLVKQKLIGWQIIPIANSINEASLSDNIIPDSTIIRYLSASSIRLSPIRLFLRVIRNILFLINIKRVVNIGTPILLSSEGKKALNQFVSADALVVSGAGNIHDGYMRGVGLFWCLMIFGNVIAGRPTVLLGQQIGPLKNKLSRLIVRYSLRGVSFLGVRDQLSYETVLDLGIPEQIVYLTGDDGWHLEAESNEEVNNILKNSGITGEYIAVQFRLDENNPWNDKLLAIANQLDQLAEYYSLPIVFIPFYYSNKLDDREACNLLANQLSSKNIVLDLDPNPALIKGILGTASVAIGVANHFCVFAASMGIPTIALYSTPYMKHKLVGLNKFCNNVSILSSKDILSEEIFLKTFRTLSNKTKTINKGFHIDRKPDFYFNWIDLVSNEKVNQ